MPELGDLPSTGQRWDRPVWQGRHRSGVMGWDETARAERSGVGETESCAGPRPCDPGSSVPVFISFHTDIRVLLMLLPVSAK